MLRNIYQSSYTIFINLMHSNTWSRALKCHFKLKGKVVVDCQEVVFEYQVKTCIFWVLEVVVFDYYIFRLLVLKIWKTKSWDSGSWLSHIGIQLLGWSNAYFLDQNVCKLLQYFMVKFQTYTSFQWVFKDIYKGLSLRKHNITLS